jgi:hypothetical protein
MFLSLPSNFRRPRNLYPLIKMSSPCYLLLYLLHIKPILPLRRLETHGECLPPLHLISKYLNTLFNFRNTGASTLPSDSPLMILIVA